MKIIGLQDLNHITFLRFYNRREEISNRENFAGQKKALLPLTKKAYASLGESLATTAVAQILVGIIVENWMNGYASTILVV